MRRTGSTLSGTLLIAAIVLLGLGLLWNFQRQGEAWLAQSRLARCASQSIETERHAADLAVALHRLGQDDPVAERMDRDRRERQYRDCQEASR